MKGCGSTQCEAQGLRLARAADARVEVHVLQRAGFPAQRDVGIYQQRARVLHAADHEAGFVPAAGAQRRASALLGASRDSPARFAAAHAPGSPSGTRAATRSARGRRVRTPRRALFPARPLASQSLQGSRSRGAALRPCTLPRRGCARASRARAQLAASRAAAPCRLPHTPRSCDGSPSARNEARATFVCSAGARLRDWARRGCADRTRAFAARAGMRATILAHRAAEERPAGRRAGHAAAGVATAGSRGCTAPQ